MSSSASEAEGAASRFTFIARDQREVTVMLTPALACESLYLQAALDAHENCGVVPVARGAVIELYVSYLHFRSLLRRLRRELQPTTGPHSSGKDNTKGNDAAEDKAEETGKGSASPELTNSNDGSNPWLTLAERQRLTRSAASYADAPLSCDGAAPQGLCELPARSLFARYVTNEELQAREAVRNTTTTSSSSNTTRSEGQRCGGGTRSAGPGPGLSAPLAAAIEGGPQAGNNNNNNSNNNEEDEREEDDDAEDAGEGEFELGGYALRETLDDYADVFFIERVVLRRPLHTSSSNNNNSNNNDVSSSEDGGGGSASTTSITLTLNEQQRLLELLTLADYVADQHLVRLCAHYFCCWLMRSTESDIIASFLPSFSSDDNPTTTTSTSSSSSLPVRTLSQLLQCISPPPPPQETEAEPYLTPEQRLTLLQEIRRSNAAFIDPMQ